MRTGPKLCVEAAVELLSLIHYLLRREPESLPGQWYVVFCRTHRPDINYLHSLTWSTDAYTGAIVLLVQRHCFPGLFDTGDAWRKGSEILSTYHGCSRIAFRCSKLLALSDKAFGGSATQTGQEQQTNPSCSPAGNARPVEEADIQHMDSLGGGILLESDKHRPQDHMDTLPDNLFDDISDIDWLSTVPFDVDTDIFGDSFMV